MKDFPFRLIHWGAYTWGEGLYMEIVSNEKIDELILGGAYTRGAYIRRFTVVLEKTFHYHCTQFIYYISFVLFMMRF